MDSKTLYMAAQTIVPTKTFNQNTWRKSLPMLKPNLSISVDIPQGQASPQGRKGMEKYFKKMDRRINVVQSF